MPHTFQFFGNMNIAEDKTGDIFEDTQALAEAIEVGIHETQHSKVEPIFH